MYLFFRFFVLGFKINGMRRLFIYFVVMEMVIFLFCLGVFVLFIYLLSFFKCLVGDFFIIDGN